MKAMENRLVVARVGGRWDKGDRGYKRVDGRSHMIQLFCISLELAVTLIYTGNKIALNYVHTHTHERVLVKLRKSMVGCIHLSILAAILSCSYARCYPWRKLGEEYTGSLCLISYDCMCICK